MRWLFGMLGLLFGLMVAEFTDTSMFNGAVLGTLVGVILGALIYKKPPGQATSSPTAAHSIHGNAEPSPTLAARVERLEQEVASLRHELALLRGDESAQLSAALDAQWPATLPVPPSPAEPAGISEPLPAGPMATAPATAAASEANPIDTPATPTPAAPGLFERAFSAARDWLMGGNTVVRVGIVVLFFGVAFLLKYASDNAMLPIEFRLAGVALGAVALLATGWRIGARRGAYGLVLQGGGVGVLYLTVFAATRLYGLLPAQAAFPLLVLICALSAFLAVRQDAASLAFLGSAGGFLAPILISSGGGSHVVLFSYYALLNAGILAIAWFKAWRPLNLLGFIFTFVIGTAWGVTSYHPALLPSTEPFLILFFLMYVGISLLYALRRELALRHYVDGTLVFGTPIVFLGLQAGLMSRIPFALAWSAVALAAFYVAIGFWLARRRSGLTLLFQAMLALAVIFSTLAIPLAFSGPTTSAAWAIEGAAVTWLGVRQRRFTQFGFGLLMQVAAACAYLVSQLFFTGGPALSVLNGPYIATLLLALAGIFTSWQLHGREDARAWRAWMPQVGLVAALWGLLWWISGGMNEITWYAQSHIASNRAHFTVNAGVLFTILTAWLAHALRTGLKWPLAQWPALAVSPVLAWLALAALNFGTAPLAGLGVVAWPLAIVLAYLLLWRQERDVDTRIIAPLHTLMFWTLCCLLAQQAYWRLHAYVPEGAWSWSVWAYGVGLLVLLVSTAGTHLRWPIARFARAYQLWAAGPLVALLWLWTIASLQSDGDASPLSWLPILNPLDVAQLLVFVAAYAWLRRVKALGFALSYRGFTYAVAATIFLWLNALLLRALHHWTNVPYRFEAMAQSTLAQACVSVLWTLCALAMTIWATRRASRALWLAGAVLLAVTVIKLFLFDLSHVNGIERIVSFIGIGLMLLLIGYFSPLPPKARVENDNGNTTEDGVS
ncbi:DUF2339 domain-containing protein [Trinickia sp. LjRoot230]|uniref:DUF2339 domain-containing protein n=1 Tax=Trinickia sp. LjRoot230 TaxID=3342288 RepID=UPI003ED13959